MSYLSNDIVATQMCDLKEISVQEWAEKILGDDYKNIFSDEYLRRAEKIFSMFADNLSKDDNELSETKELVDLLEAIKKEKIKVSTANLEYNANARAEARHELFMEYVTEAVARLEPIKFTYKPSKRVPSKRHGVLCIADAHNGVVINMQNVFGVDVNVYSPEILKDRLAKLLNQVVADRENYVNYDRLTIFDLGDTIQGVLRLSDLSKLKMGVIDSALDYAETISAWLTELSDKLQIPIDYSLLGGNHDELRLINAKKGDFDAENMGKVVAKFVELRLANNENIYVSPYNECVYKDIQGVRFFAIHGDNAKGNIEQIAFLENYHGVNIDILLEAHTHHKEEVSIGYGTYGGDKEIIHIPSLVGVDPYAKRLRKMSKAGAKFMVIEDGYKTWEKTIVLN